MSTRAGGLAVPVPSIPLAFAACVALTAVPRTAEAFERQWHLGGGLGWVIPKDAYSGGAAVALHLAYGISDMFDARLEMRSSLHELSAGGSDRHSFSQAMLGLAYKVDVIEWVPYIGVRAGYYRFGSAPPVGAFPAGKAYAQGGGSIGTMLGVDYAFSRSAGIGAELDYDTLLPRGGAFAATLHAEYRWGF